MDCLSLSASANYSCSNPYPTCVNEKAFEFRTLSNITNKIYQACSSDPRLWPGTSYLTNAACLTITATAVGFTLYIPSAIWARLTTWKFPLFQLIFNSPRPPLGFKIQLFVISHLLGEPVGSICDLLDKVEQCQEHAMYWAGYFGDESVTAIEKAKFNKWKALSIISISYDEEGQGNDMREELRRLLDNPMLSSELQTDIYEICDLKGKDLVADRAISFVPISAAIIIFIASIVVALVKTASSTNNPETSIFVNVEVHSIAFSALYFWIIPAIMLSALLGVSQTESFIPRSLNELEYTINAAVIKEEISKELPAILLGFLPRSLRGQRFTPPSSKDIEDKINDRTTELKQKMDLFGKGRPKEATKSRVETGGVYSWQKKESQKLKLGHYIRRQMLSHFIVLLGTITAISLSGNVPPNGWQPRHCGQASILLVWLLSHVLTTIIRRQSSWSFTFQFWLTYAKDMISMIATLGGIAVVQFGAFNRCDSNTRWSKTWLHIPGYDIVDEDLKRRIANWYPAITALGLGLQVIVIPLFVAWQYPQALQVLLQSDDGKPNLSWLIWGTRMKEDGEKKDGQELIQWFRDDEAVR